jgi:hypothetical protein
MSATERGILVLVDIVVSAVDRLNLFFCGGDQRRAAFYSGISLPTVQGACRLRHRRRRRSSRNLLQLMRPKLKLCQISLSSKGLRFACALHAGFQERDLPLPGAIFG